MTTILRPPTTARTEPDPPPRPGRAARPSGALLRNRTRIGIGVVVIVLSVLGVVTLVSRGAQRQTVLALVADVPAGTAITSGDLATVELPVDAGLPVINADQAPTLLGQTATVTLLRGTLLNQSHLSSEARVPAGMSLIGAVLNPGQYPPGLREGDQVELIQTPPVTAGPSDQTVTNLGSGEVRAIAEPPTGASALVVSLLVADNSADAVAAAGAQGRISLVVVGSK